MRWPACDTLLVDVALMDCMVLHSSDIRRHLVKKEHSAAG